MERLTLRGAAERTGLSVTTLRRYIRSGRLAAEKIAGRYGPEYTIAATALAQAGALAPAKTGSSGLRPPEGDRGGSGNGGPAGYSDDSTPHGALATRPIAPEILIREMIPIDLFRELSMKHEQLLVQYGMVRVGGQRMMEYKIEAERLADSLREAQDAIRSDQERHALERSTLEQDLRKAELEIEVRTQEIAALREQIRNLEVVSRNAITTKSIEQQFSQVFDKRRELEELTGGASEERRRHVAALDELLRSKLRLGPEPDSTDQ